MFHNRFIILVLVILIMPGKKYTVSAIAIALSGILLFRKLAAANASLWMLGLGLLGLANSILDNKYSSAKLTVRLPELVGTTSEQSRMIKGIITLAGLYALGKYAKALQLTGNLRGVLEQIPGVKGFANLGKGYAIGLMFLGLLINAVISSRKSYVAVKPFFDKKARPKSAFRAFAEATAKSFFAQLDLGTLIK